MFGKLSWDAIPTTEPIVMYTLAVVGLIGVALVGSITWKRKWGYLWREWFTSVDHKKIGCMYIIVALVMLLRGFSDAIMMRTQQAMAASGGPGYLPPEHYDQIFTAHGVIMIFFMAMPFVVGLMNIVVPLQIGARDVAYPFLNALSFWLFVVGAALVNISLGVGEFARTGWVAYPPLSELGYSPGVGVDYYIWSLQISGIGTLLTGVNFFVTILKMRTEGMTLFKMPVFTWNALCTSVLILAAFPILTATLLMLTLDRYLGMHFFTNGAGGNVNAFFGIMTMIIAVPTGVKIFTWLFTMYRGRVRFETPMLWTLGFIVTFSIGGMTGVLLAVPGADFLLHNSLFLIAHFHNVIIGGAVFGYMAGLTYWFPKAFGFRLNDKLGRIAFWCWLVGFYFAFMPSYVLGFMGMTRRLNHFDNPEWRPWLLLELVGVAIILCGVATQALQLLVSIRNRHQYRDLTGDPWDGRTLEWATASPPPLYNFAEQPKVNDLDAYWGMKERGVSTLSHTDYRSIHMPRNTASGLVISLFALVCSFALVWHIWWMAAFGLVASVVAFVVRSYDEDTDYFVPAQEVARIETARLKDLAEA